MTSADPSATNGRSLSLLDCLSYSKKSKNNNRYKNIASPLLRDDGIFNHGNLNRGDYRYPFDPHYVANASNFPKFIPSHKYKTEHSKKNSYINLNMLGYTPISSGLNDLVLENATDISSSKNRPSILPRSCVLCFRRTSRNESVRILPCANVVHVQCAQLWFFENRSEISCKNIQCCCHSTPKVNGTFDQCPTIPPQTFIKLGYLLLAGTHDTISFPLKKDEWSRTCRALSNAPHAGAAPPMIGMLWD
jgi:hypothetical protein